MSGFGELVANNADVVNDIANIYAEYFKNVYESVINVKLYFRGLQRDRQLSVIKAQEQIIYDIINGNPKIDKTKFQSFNDFLISNDNGIKDKVKIAFALTIGSYPENQQEERDSQIYDSNMTLFLITLLCAPGSPEYTFTEISDDELEEAVKKHCIGSKGGKSKKNSRKNRKSKNKTNKTNKKRKGKSRR